MLTWWCVFVFKPGGGICHSYSYGVRAVIQCLPAWFRFVQCLRRYRDTRRARPHLLNAGKYSTTFFVVIFSALYKTHEGKHLRCYIPYLKFFVNSTWNSLETSVECTLCQAKCSWYIFRDWKQTTHRTLRNTIWLNVQSCVLLCLWCSFMSLPFCYH